MAAPCPGRKSLLRFGSPTLFFYGVLPLLVPSWLPSHILTPCLFVFYSAAGAYEDEVLTKTALPMSLFVQSSVIPLVIRADSSDGNTPELHLCLIPFFVLACAFVLGGCILHCIIQMNLGCCRRRGRRFESILVFFAAWAAGAAGAGA